jgi:NADH-quinone oxidoreductase subunit M
MTATTTIPWLTVLLVLPLAGALLCLALCRFSTVCRWLAVLVAGAELLLAIWLFVTLGSGGAGGEWLLYEDASWIGRFGIRYTLGLDGISLLLVLLTAFVQFLGIIVSLERRDHIPAFMAMLLLLESAIIGVFLALDLFLFYLFWEAMLIPMFFMIIIWGRHERRFYAAVKFFLFTLGGSLFLLLGIIALHLLHAEQSGTVTFSLAALQQAQIPPSLAPWLFAAFFLGFAVKVPIVPLHTWLPDAHTEAPTAGSLDLAGLLLKTGMYGLLRITFPLFPEETQAILPPLAIFGLVAIFYAAWIAYAQQDIKRLVAYSSVSHVGFMVLGFAAWNATAVEGSILQMFNHGISTGALFIMIGMINHRAGTRQLDQLGGLWGKTPILSAFFLFFALSSLGLPGLNNFVGEILILLGTFQRWPVLAAIAVLGVVYAAAYMLRLVHGTLWGPEMTSKPWPDMTWREGIVLVPLALLVLWLGLYPVTFLEPLRVPVQLVLEHRLPLPPLSGVMP